MCSRGGAVWREIQQGYADVHLGEAELQECLQPRQLASAPLKPSRGSNPGPNGCYHYSITIRRPGTAMAMLLLW
ncbi:g10129 [Coccomyxa elongata]